MTTLDVMLPRMDAVTTVRYAIVYLRLSDFRAEDDNGTFTRREEELRELAEGLGLTVRWVLVENDLRNDGKLRSASAYKTPRKITDGNGIATRRTNRVKFTEALLLLQSGQAQVLIAGSSSRLSREERDARDLVDVVKSSGASVLVPDDEGEPQWLLSHGGTPKEIADFMDEVNGNRRYSEQVAANARKGRRRWVGKSWQGGPRPFGFRVAQGTEEHKRNLVVDEAEAKVLADAADAILDKGISLASIARDLREATGDDYVSTVSGTKWRASTLRDVLSKPGTAGLQVRKDGTLTDAPWPAIVPRDRWERLVALFDSRKTGRGNEPRWLVSGIAVCGIDGAHMRVTGTADRRAYVCSAHGHVRRNALKVDDWVSTTVIRYLARPDLADVLPDRKLRAGADTVALRAESKRLAAKRDDLARLLMDEVLTEKGVRIERERIDARLTAIGAELASDTADELPEVQGAPDDPAERLRWVQDVWFALPLARRRAIVRILVRVTILPIEHRGGNVFDPASVRIEEVFD